MTSAFNLPSLFFGIYLIIPLVLGSYLLFGFRNYNGSLTKAQRLAGCLLLVDALYLIVRTALIAQAGLHNPVLRFNFFIMDSTMLTVFALIPYTVITERYPQWWMFLLSLMPLVLIPIIHFTNMPMLATWSHILPIAVAIIVLILSIKYARKADKNLTDIYADPEVHEKSWIIWLCAGFIVVTIASFMRYIFHGFTWYNLLVNCLWSGLMISIFWMLTRQKPLGGGGRNPLFEEKSNFSLKLKDETRENNYEIIGKALTNICVEKQFYLKHDLTLDFLAHECGTNRTYLGMYFKEVLHQTLYEYINSLRLQQVDELLQDATLKQEEIATQCGFNSARNMRRAYLKIRGRELSR